MTHYTGKDVSPLPLIGQDTELAVDEVVQLLLCSVLDGSNIDEGFLGHGPALLGPCYHDVTGAEALSQAGQSSYLLQGQLIGRRRVDVD